MQFHTLASSDWRPPTAEEEAAGWRWTYRVDVAFAGPDSRVAMSLTAPRENHAAVLGLDELGSPGWAEHRDRAGAAWLDPWFERLGTAGPWRSRRVRRDLLAEFARRHGRRPTSYTWDV